MNARTQRACAWSGIAMIVLFFLGFGAIAGFIPPINPNSSPEHIADIFQGRRNRIRVGMMVVTFSAALVVTFVSVYYLQLRRIEKRNPVLALVQFASGTLLS